MSRPSWRPLRFRPYLDTLEQPNVIVDGQANQSTTLTLSHWPHAACPAPLQRDSSAEIAFAYLDDPGRHGDAEWVSNNHFDQDGLVGVHVLTEPEAASSHRDLLVDVAWVGDFAVARRREAARISMAVAAFADPDRSPLGPATFADGYDQACALLYDEVLGRLPELIDHPDRYRPLWAEEDAVLDDDERWLAAGGAVVEEVPELDLSVVTLAEGHRSSGGHRFGGMWSGRVHPIALHAHVGGHALLLGQGDRWELRYRYESWVQFVSRPVRPRVDLDDAAAELTALEPDGGAVDLRRRGGAHPGPASGGRRPERRGPRRDPLDRRAPAADRAGGVGPLRPGALVPRVVLISGDGVDVGAAGQVLGLVEQDLDAVGQLGGEGLDRLA